MLRRRRTLLHTPRGRCGYGRHRRPNRPGLQHAAGRDVDAARRRTGRICGRRAALHGAGDGPSRRLRVQDDPRRRLDPAQGQRPGRGLREPRASPCRSRTTRPGQAVSEPERLREQRGQRARDPWAELSGRPGIARDHEPRELPAVLLELPRNARRGLRVPLLFTNEEAQDWVYRRGDAWPGPDYITPGTHGAEQAGVVVAYNPLTGQRKTIYGMGRHNHENSVAVPGFSKRVVLSGDDTFQTNAPASSQLYMYRPQARATSGTTRGRSTRSARTARTTTTSIFSRARSSPARLSRCRRTSPAASRRWTVTS